MGVTGLVRFNLTMRALTAFRSRSEQVATVVCLVFLLLFVLLPVARLAVELVVGLLGSGVGLGLGVLLAIGIRALFARLGLDLSGTGLVFSARTPIVAMAVGVARHSAHGHETTSSTSEPASQDHPTASAPMRKPPAGRSSAPAGSPPTST